MRCGFYSDKKKLITCAVDTLTEVYENLKNNFEWKINMSNSLDHTFDAVFAIYQLLYICKIGGVVILRHHENEAETEKYEKLHQWNLSVKNPEHSFVIWNKEKRFDIGEIYMNDEVFNQCLEYIPPKQDGYFSIHGLGEPLFHPKFVPYLTKLAEIDTLIFISSNGLLFDKK